MPDLLAGGVCVRAIVIVVTLFSSLSGWKLPRVGFSLKSVWSCLSASSSPLVVRSSSPVLVVRFEPALSPSARLRAAAIVGHAFGNQHVPIEVAEDEIRVPLTTSAEVALTTVAALGLPGVIATVANLPIACRVALSGSESAHAHHAGAASPPGHHDHHHDHDHGAL